MALKLIKIGNSKGIRIPKDFLHGFTEDTKFDLKREGDNLILSASNHSRTDWIDQMKNEKIIETDFILNDFDENDWEWK